MMARRTACGEEIEFMYKESNADCRQGVVEGE